MGRVIRIERLSSRPGTDEAPVYGPRGYQLADPRHGSTKHHAAHAMFVATLDEAAELVEKGYSLWMTAAGKRPSLISPRSLRIVRGGV